MGLKDRAQIKLEQRKKRKKMREKIASGGEDPNKHFINGIYVGTKKAD